jgi:hypothetical protein
VAPTSPNMAKVITYRFKKLSKPIKISSEKFTQTQIRMKLKVKIQRKNLESSREKQFESL